MSDNLKLHLLLDDTEVAWLSVIITRARDRAAPLLPKVDAALAAAKAGEEPGELPEGCIRVEVSEDELDAVCLVLKAQVDIATTLLGKLERGEVTVDDTELAWLRVIIAGECGAAAEVLGAVEAAEAADHAGEVADGYIRVAVSAAEYEEVHATVKAEFERATRVLGMLNALSPALANACVACGSGPGVECASHCPTQLPTTPPSGAAPEPA